jgi:hypothetical protein
MLRTRTIIHSVCLAFFCLQLQSPSLLIAEGFKVQLNGQEQAAIYEIFTSMGEKNLAWLLMDSKRLTSLGESIQHVPPLQLIGYILTDSHLKSCMRKISKSYFKWSAFIDGFGSNMDIELDSGRLLEELDEFALITNANQYSLHSIARNRDWEQFVLSLL